MRPPASISLPTLALAALSFILIPGRSSGQNVLTNPGFDNGTTGWSTGCSIEVNPETVYGGVNASNYVTEIDIERCFNQQATVVPGGIYYLSFIASRRQAGTPDTTGVTVTVTGNQSGLQYVNASTVYTNKTWAYTTQTYMFSVAPGTTDNSVTINFSNYKTTGTYGTLIDDINFNVDPSSVMLPLRVTSFSGAVSNHIATLNWTVAEAGSAGDRFVIERGTTGGRFDSVGEAAGAGRSFSYSDMKMGSGTNVYRLHVIGNNSSTYSKLLSLQNDGGVATLRVYPNPASVTITVSAHFTTAHVALAKVFDAIGTLKSSKQFNVNSGDNNILIDVASLASGQYFLQIDGQVTQFCKR